MTKEQWRKYRDRHRESINKSARYYYYVNKEAVLKRQRRYRMNKKVAAILGVTYEEARAMK